MISQNMSDAINLQINRELYSAYLYQAMSTHCAHEGLPGFSAWLSAQAREEAGHAFKFHGYLLEQGARPVWKAIEEPPSVFESPVEMFAAVLKHEQFVTGSIRDLMDLALAEKDYATQIMLQWFVSEQVEEESTAQEVLDKVRKLAGDDRGLYLLDRELGQRQAG